MLWSASIDDSALVEYRPMLNVKTCGLSLASFSVIASLELFRLDARGLRDKPFALVTALLLHNTLTSAYLNCGIIHVRILYLNITD